MGGHGDEPLKPTKYHSIDEIPDELIPQYSKRDPDNQLYKTRRWVNFKKKQIMFQQNDGVPHWLRTRGSKIVHYTMWTGCIGMFLANCYYLNHYTNNPKKN